MALNRLMNSPYWWCQLGIWNFHRYTSRFNCGGFFHRRRISGRSAKKFPDIICQFPFAEKTGIEIGPPIYSRWFPLLVWRVFCEKSRNARAVLSLAHETWTIQIQQNSVFGNCVILKNISEIASYWTSVACLMNRRIFLLEERKIPGRIIFFWNPAVDR